MERGRGRTPALIKTLRQEGTWLLKGVSVAEKTRKDSLWSGWRGQPGQIRVVSGDSTGYLDFILSVIRSL